MKQTLLDALALSLVLLGLLLLDVSAAAGGTATNITITATPSYATAAPNVTATSATNITDTTAILHGSVTNDGGGTITMRGFEWGTATGNYTSSWNETGSYGAGAFSHSIGNLTFCTTVYWRAFAVNDFGRGNSTEQNFSTSCIPYAPTNFVITQTGSSSANLTWTMGAGATRTIIRGSDNNYPTTITGGYLVYNGTGTDADVEGLNLDTTSYYYSAWSENSHGVSTDYAQASIQGGGFMTLIALFAFCGIVSFMSLRSRFYLLKLLAGACWIAMLVYWIYVPPASITAGSPPHIAVMIVLIGLAVAIPILGLGREIETQKDWRTGLSTEKTGAFHFKLPDWLRSPEAKVESQRKANLSEYKDKLHKALNPGKKEKE